VRSRPWSAAGAGGRSAAQRRAGFAGALEAFDQSMSATVIRRIGAPEDVSYCAEENVSELVPVLSFGDGIPALVVRKETRR